MFRGAPKAIAPDTSSDIKPKSQKKTTSKNPVVKALSGVLKLFTIIKTFSGKLLWYSSCGKSASHTVALLYLLPTQILLFKDQEAIM